MCVCVFCVCFCSLTPFNLQAYPPEKGVFKPGAAFSWRLQTQDTASIVPGEDQDTSKIQCKYMGVCVVVDFMMYVYTLGCTACGY